MQLDPPARARLASWTVALGTILGTLALPLLLLVWLGGGGPRLGFIQPGRPVPFEPPLAVEVCAAALAVVAGLLWFAVAPRLPASHAEALKRLAVVVSGVGQVTLVVCGLLVNRAGWIRALPVHGLP
jgi:hypothetical protein